MDEKETAPGSLAAALAELQTKLPHIAKDKTAKVVSNKGNYSYTYADLAAISAKLLPIMGGLGLSFTSCPTMQDGAFVLAYSLRHVNDEERITGSYPLRTDVTPQQMGGLITFARRYCLCAVTGLSADDDDDAQAAEKAARKPRARRPLPMPETDEHGAATFAEQTRMVTGAVDGVERLTGTPPDDPWLTVDGNGERRPPGQLPKPIGPQPPKPGSMQERLPHVAAIRMHFDRIGVTDRAQRLNVTAKLAGLDTLATSNDLTEPQGKAVQDALSRCKDSAALVALMAERELAAAEPA